MKTIKIHIFSFSNSRKTEGVAVLATKRLNAQRKLYNAWVFLAHDVTKQDRRKGLGHIISKATALKKMSTADILREVQRQKEFKLVDPKKIKIKEPVYGSPHSPILLDIYFEIGRRSAGK